jgi:hypothetical protein
MIYWMLVIYVVERIFYFVSTEKGGVYVLIIPIISQLSTTAKCLDAGNGAAATYR